MYFITKDICDDENEMKQNPATDEIVILRQIH